MNLLIAPYKLNSKPWPHHPGCNKRAETLRHFNNILIHALFWFIIKQARTQEDIFLNAFIFVLHVSRSHGLVPLQIDAWTVLKLSRLANEFIWERKKPSLENDTRTQDELRVEGPQATQLLKPKTQLRNYTQYIRSFLTPF